MGFPCTFILQGSFIARDSVAVMAMNVMDITRIGAHQGIIQRRVIGRGRVGGAFSSLFCKRPNVTIGQLIGQRFSN